MSGISKIIERARELHAKMESDESNDNSRNFEYCAIDSIMPVITAYEQSQQELEKSNDCLDTIGETHSGLLELYHKTNDELSKANKCIAELERFKVLYEQSQKELESARSGRKIWRDDSQELKADLDTANKRIFAFEGQEPRRKWLEEEVINRKKKIAEAKADLDTAKKLIEVDAETYQEEIAGYVTKNVELNKRIAELEKEAVIETENKPPVLGLDEEMI